MGAKLVGLVFDNWVALPDSCFRILMRMALTALDNATDDHPAGVYYGGWEPLSAALNQRGSVATRRAYVRKSVQLLIKAGAITRLSQGSGREHSRYLLLVHLTPDQAVKPAEAPGEGS